MTDFELEPEESLLEPDTQSPLIESSFKIAGKDEVSFIESYVEEKIEENPLAGDFFIVLELVGMTVDEGEDIGESFTQTFRKAFYSNLELDPYSRFEEGLSEVNKVAEDLAAEHALDFKKLNIAIGVVVEDLVFVSSTCDAEVYIIRKGTVKNIAEGIKKSKNEENLLFSNVASGNLDEGDTVLMTTARLVRYIANTEIGRCFLNKDVNTGVEYLEDILRMEVVGRVGILAIRVNGFNLAEEEFAPKSSRVNWARILNKDGLGPKVVASLDFALKSAKNFIKLFWSSSLKFASKIATLFAGRKIDFNQTSKKLTVFVGGGILLSIALVIYVIFSVSFISLDYKEARAALVSAESTLQSAKSEPDKEKAVKMILDVESKIKLASEFNSLKADADDLKSQLNDVRSVLDNVIVVTKPMIAADISKNTKNLKGVVNFGSTMFAYDDFKAFEFLSGIVKDPVEISSDNDLEVVSLSYFEDAESLIYLMSNGKVKEYAKSISKFVQTSDVNFKSAVDLVGYGPRLYLLDPEGNQIWRYQKRRDSYAGAEAYVRSVNTSGLNGSVSMAIDGAIYVLFSNGKIEKYYAGEKVPEFTVENQPLIPLDSPTKIYTDLSLPYVFVLEPTSKRILLYAKDAKSGNLRYTTQYYFQDLDKITGFTVDYPTRKIFVSDSKKVYVTNITNE